MPRLWLSLYLPRFPLEMFSRGGELSMPAAVVAGRGNRLRVSVCNESAEAMGIYPGMGLSSACALVPHLHVLKRDEAAEAAALDGLAAWSGQFTSLTSVMPLQGLLLEMGGSVNLFGGAEPLRRRIRESLEALGYTARFGIAPTPLGSWLLARAGFEQPATDGPSLPARLAPVPLECMGFSSRVIQTLQGMGLQCFGDCHRLPRDGLARRVGSELVDFLDRALGRHPDPRTPYVAPQEFERRLVLSSEVWDAEALLFAARRLLLELTGFLKAKDGGIHSLEVLLFHRNHPHTRLGVELFTPSRDFQHLMSLLRERLELLKLPEAVEQVGLKVREILNLVPQNLDFFDGANRSLEDGQSLVERLHARLGKQAVQGLDVVADHRPERAWRYAIPGVKPSPVAGFAFRPLWLLQRPQALKTVRGKPYFGGILSFAAGPECIESGWWDGGDVIRNYFVAQNPKGECFWVFRERSRPAGWFLHGVFA